MPARSELTVTPLELELEFGRFLFGREARALTLSQLLSELAHRLNAAGVPVQRLMSGLNARHPEIQVEGVMWSSGVGAQTRMLSYEELAAEPRDTPFAALRFDGLARIRERLAEGQPVTYPMLEKLRADGYTDYLACTLGDDGRVSWATTTPGGWSDEQLEALDRLVPALGAVIELREKRAAMTSLLHVYLGADAAARVLDGEVRRGAGTTLRCVAWFCDLRGFTELSDRLPPADVVRLLDAVFERVGAAIVDRGGHILKFIGDAVLAVFPIGDISRGSAVEAVRAARDAQAALAALNAERGEHTQMGIALHIGEVFYGNVGSRERLDFTVIGATVNEVCRIEALCKPLGADVLCSQELANVLGKDGLVDHGEHALKGVTRRVRVYGLAPAV